MNPVITRELTSQLRTRRSFVQLGILLSIIAVVFCMVYHPISKTWPHGNLNGRSLFFPLIYISMLLALPITTMAATSIVRERETKTLDLLLTAPLKPRSILFAKCVANLLYALLILSSTLPFLVICFLFGGLSPSEVFQCCLVIGGFYCVAVVLGVAISLLSVSSETATRVSIMALILFLFGLTAAKICVGYVFFSPSYEPRSGLELWINPLYAVRSMEVPYEPLRAIAWTSPSSSSLREHIGFITGGLNLLIALVLFVSTVKVFRSLGPHLSTYLSWKNLIPRLRDFLERTGVRVSDSGISPLFDPYGRSVYQKEILSFNRKSYSRDVTLISSCCVLSLLLAVLLFCTAMDVKDFDISVVYMLLCIFGIVIAFLFAPVGPTYSILAEQRRDTWPLLRVTTLFSEDIVKGKIYAAFRQASIPLLSIFLSFYIACCLLFFWNKIVPDRFYLLEIFAITALFLCCIFFYSCLGVMFSSVPPKPRRSPYRKALLVALFHLFPGYVLLFIPGVLMSFISSPRIHVGPGGLPKRELVYRSIDYAMESLQQFSPLSTIFHREWNMGDYTITCIHCAVLVALGFVFMNKASKYVEKME
ncbi:MAG: ABC transporter permease subunit [bacterium]